MSDHNLLAIFRDEIEGSLPRLQDIVLALEAGTGGREDGQEAMRVTHALKGAARIVGAPALAAALHAAESVLAVTTRGDKLQPDEVQRLLVLVDVLDEASLMAPAELDGWLAAREPVHAEMAARLRGGDTTPQAMSETIVGDTRGDPRGETRGAAGAGNTEVGVARPEVADRPGEARAVRVPADALSRLLGAAGSVVVEARRLGGGQRAAFALARTQARIEEHISELRRQATRSGDAALAGLAETIVGEIAEARALAAGIQSTTAEGVQRLHDASEHLFLEALSVRQRPFAELVPTLRRHVRETARALGKSVRLDLTGATTPLDGDVLAGLEAVLGHLITNAIDHGIEPEAVRRQRMKSPQGVIALEVARVRAEIVVRVGDDGGGIDPDKVRAGALERRLIEPALAGSLQRTEVLELLFLPGFSLAPTLSVHSGRGVGLDAVRAMVRQLGGHVAISSELERGTRFELTLPVTRVVVRALIIEVAGELYALPLAKIGRVVRMSAAAVKSAEGRDYVSLEDTNVGLVRADEVFEVFAPEMAPRVDTELTIVVVGHHHAVYGLVVDRALGEDDLVVQPLDTRLGHVQDVAAGALLADGAPTLLLDIDDLVVSIERLTRRRRPRPVMAEGVATRKHVLVTDDSPVVREMLRLVLTSNGYKVTVANDGLAALELMRKASFDLLIVDVEMPRLTGFELLRKLRTMPEVAEQPAIIVSYLDDEAHRREGLAAGARHFLSKNDFDDQRLLKLVRQLIGWA